MNQSNKVLLTTILSLLAAVALFFGWPYPFIVISTIYDVHHSNLERAQLLYRTDHAALLAACRQVITNRQTFARDLDWHGPQDPKTSFIDPHDPRIPAVITKLNPRDVIATDTDVKLELHGGFDHYGVIALSAEATPGAGNNFHGPFELIPGLWYYDEGLVEDHDAWLRKLKNLRPYGVAEPTW